MQRLVKILFLITLFPFIAKGQEALLQSSKFELSTKYFSIPHYLDSIYDSPIAIHEKIEAVQYALSNVLARNATRDMLICWMDLGRYYGNSGKYFLSQHYFQKVLLHSHSKDVIHMNAAINLAITQTYLGDYRNAIYLLKQLETNSGNTSNQRNGIYQLISNYSFALGDTGTALYFIHKGLKSSEQSPKHQSLFLNKLGAALIKTQPQKALQYLEKSLNIAQQYSLHQEELMALGNLASLTHQEKRKEANNYFEAYQKAIHLHKYPASLTIEYYTHLGYLQLLHHDTFASLANIQHAIFIADSLQSPWLKTDGLKLQASILAAQKEFQQALAIQQEITALQMQPYLQHQPANLNEFEILHKLKDAQQARQVNLLQLQTAQKQVYFKLFVSGILLLIVILLVGLVVVIKRNSDKRKQYLSLLEFHRDVVILQEKTSKQHELYLEQTRLFSMELHDGIAPLFAMAQLHLSLSPYYNDKQYQELKYQIQQCNQQIRILSHELHNKWYLTGKKVDTYA